MISGGTGPSPFPFFQRRRLYGLGTHGVCTKNLRGLFGHEHRHPPGRAGGTCPVELRTHPRYLRRYPRLCEGLQAFCRRRRRQRPGVFSARAGRSCRRAHGAGCSGGLAQLRARGRWPVLVGRIRHQHRAHGLPQSEKRRARPAVRQHPPKRQDSGRTDRRPDFH